ncbi:MAG: DUF1015 domain-containing protein [Actinobacteria bacterium]|nr:DUF1015 domain-containing protein [Actinomycetota bacterium]
MPQVSPFTGLLFDPAVVGPVDRVTAPPYDMITADEERRFHAASPHNVVRLILGRADGLPGAAPDKYTGAASHLRRWREEGALVESPSPSWFPYEMRFTFQGEDRTLRGVICAVDVEPWGGTIVPHEETLEASVEDRLALLRKVRANLSPVYAVATGPCRPLSAMLAEVSQGPPAREATDDEGVRHRLWVVDGDTPVGAWLAEDRLLIADGHHRYTTALAYREEMRASMGPGPWDRMMMLVVDGTLEDPPVLPIHRVLVSGDPAGLPDGARVRDLAEVLVTVRDRDLTFGLVRREDGETIHRVARLEGSPPTVCALHEQVLGSGVELRFTPDAVAAEEAVRLDRAPAAFFLPSTHVDGIHAVIERGGRLPQKSTYFWPKPRTGMVIRPMD